MVAHDGKAVIDMALTLDDVISLAKAGYTKSDVVAFMNLGNTQTTPPSPVQVPGGAAPTAQPNRLSLDEIAALAAMAKPTVEKIPATPDLGQLTASLADLTKKVDALSVPTAGSVGALPTVTSVEDIIMGALKPAPAPESPFDMKGDAK